MSEIEKLIKARANLARLKELPESDFTVFPSPFNHGIRFGVDEKAAAIQRAEAEVAELQILTELESEHSTNARASLGQS